MAEALIFHYRKQETFLNHCNPATKFLSVIILCILLVSSSLLGTSLISAILLLLAVQQHLPLRQYKRELRFFFILMALIGLTDYLANYQWTSTANALLRFFSIILCGMLLADSTSPDDLARSLGSILNHIPLINGWRIASGIELTISMLPMIFDASLEASVARKARLENNRHPYRAIIGLTTSIFSLLLDKAEDLSIALEARNFNPDKIRARLPYKKVDLLLILLVIGLVMLIRMV